MARTNLNAKPTAPKAKAASASPSSSKALTVYKPLIAKGKGKIGAGVQGKDPKKSKGTKGGQTAKKGKGIKYEVWVVTADSAGQHVGCALSNENVKFILASSSVSRADGNLEEVTPPPSPSLEEDNVFKEVKMYDFTIEPKNLKFPYPGPPGVIKCLEDKGKKPIPTLYPDIKLLKKLAVYDQIHGLFMSSGMGLVFSEDPGSYPTMIIEFLSTFSDVVETVDNRPVVQSWQFCLGGKVWRIDAQVLRDWLRLSYEGITPDVSDEVVFDFWKRISGQDYKKESCHNLSSIEDPVWKIVHRLLAGTVFMRTNYGRTVTKLEMAVMYLMEQKIKVDWLWCIGRGICDNMRMKIEA